MMPDPSQRLRRSPRPGPRARRAILIGLLMLISGLMYAEMVQRFSP